jgi:type IV secretion system protein VirB10
MNRLPLVIVLVIVVTVLILLLIAASQRTNKARKANNTGETVQVRNANTGSDAILRGYDMDGTVEPNSRRIRSSQDIEKESVSDLMVPVVPAIENQKQTSKYDDKDMLRATRLSEEEKRYLERARQFREDLFYDAVVSDTTVRVSNNQNRTENSLNRENTQTEIGRRFTDNLQKSVSEALSSVRGADLNLQGRKNEF